jgi:UDP-N-acetylglucosamine 2-epimerase (non-hydrolysing)
MKILLVVGARPNFVKIAPIIRAIEKYDDIEYKLIHTGQHYDRNMSSNFFKELEISKPDINLGVGSKTHANQTAMIMTLFEAYCLDENPDIVLVVGDVNSTLACSIVVSKLKGIKLAHVESGERSFDRDMPEEINRIVTDVLSDYLFCTTKKSVNNLLKEGCDKGKIHLVGNVAIDTLLYNISRLTIRQDIEPYILCTIHRQSNTDIKKNLEIILRSIDYISDDFKVIFPIHPRTLKKVKEYKFDKYLENIDVVKPMNYINFLYNIKGALLVLTDSGGIQVETTVLDIPCLTIRENTEWKFTLTEGTNVLINDITEDNIIEEYMKIINGEYKHKNLSRENIKLLDGNTSNRIVDILREGI